MLKRAKSIWAGGALVILFGLLIVVGAVAWWPAADHDGSAGGTTRTPSDLTAHNQVTARRESNRVKSVAPGVAVSKPANSTAVGLPRSRKAPPVTQPETDRADATRATSSLRGTPTTPAAVLADLIAKVGDASVVSGAVGAAPAGFRQTDALTQAAPPGPTSGQWVYLKIRASSASPEDLMRAGFAAQVIAAALRDRFESTGLEPLLGATAHAVLPDGVERELTVGLAESQGASFATNASEARSSIIDAQATSGVHVDSVTFLRPLQLAPIVIASTTSPEAVAANPLAPALALFGDPPKYEAYLLIVRDSSGSPVSVTYSAFRAGAGSSWVRSDLGGKRGEATPR